MAAVISKWHFDQSRPQKGTSPIHLTIHLSYTILNMSYLINDRYHLQCDRRKLFVQKCIANPPMGFYLVHSPYNYTNKLRSRANPQAQMGTLYCNPLVQIFFAP